MKYADGSSVSLGDVVTLPLHDGDHEGRVVIMRITSVILRTLAIAPLLIELVVLLSGHVITKDYAENVIMLAWLFAILSLLILALITKKERSWNLLTCLCSVPLVFLVSIIYTLNFGRD